MDLYWHLHHDQLFELATEPIENRREYINDHKPKSEISTRLRLLRRIIGPIPATLDKASATLDKAYATRAKASFALEKASAAARGKAYSATRAKARGEAWDKAYVALVKASAVWASASAKSMDEMTALHARECPNCPWNGKTIFPEENA